VDDVGPVKKGIGKITPAAIHRDESVGKPWRTGNITGRYGFYVYSAMSWDKLAPVYP
jgi:hypothetical protein